MDYLSALFLLVGANFSDGFAKYESRKIGLSIEEQKFWLICGSVKDRQGIPGTI